MSGRLRAADDVVRPATPADLDAVVAIERLSFSDPPWSRGSFAALIGDPQVQFLVASMPDPAWPPGGVRSGHPPEEAGVIAGYVVTWTVLDEADLSNLAVAPTFRGRGIGRRLLEAAITGVRRMGVRSLFLEVRESNVVALTLYASRGFAPVGRRRRYYRQPVEDALILQLDLTRVAGAGPGLAAE